MTKKLTDILKKPFPKTTSFNLGEKGGYHPHKREAATKSFLKKLVVQDHGEPFENDFKANVKTFDRGAHRYGHDNVDWNSFDNSGGLKMSELDFEEIENDDIEMLGEVLDAYFEENPDASFHQAYSDIMEEIDQLDEAGPPGVSKAVAKKGEKTVSQQKKAIWGKAGYKYRTTITVPKKK